MNKPFAAEAMLFCNRVALALVRSWIALLRYYRRLVSLVSRYDAGAPRPTRSDIQST